MRRATTFSNSSPTWWPALSLTCLNLSRSMNSSASMLPSAAARASAAGSASASHCRFGSPVSTSCLVMRTNCC